MKRIRLVPLLSTVVLLSACTVVPGSHLSTNGKTTVATGTVDIDQLADIYPVTPALLSQLRKAPVVGRANPELNSQITTYEYRIGVGDILNVTVWDHQSSPYLPVPTAVLARQETGYMLTVPFSILILAKSVLWVKPYPKYGVILPSV